MPTWLDKLSKEQKLPPEGYREILSTEDRSMISDLFSVARGVALSVFGNGVYIRGLIEISNYCRNNCYYCGIRSGNKEVERYRLSKETIMRSCQAGYELGMRTFVLQGGEDPRQSISWLTDVVSSIRNQYPDCAITLSLGEKSREEYATLYASGANRYLLRHETHNAEHYSVLHPSSMSIAHRKQCLYDLKAIGFQTGAGGMVGSPGQTVDHLVEDLLFLQEFRPEMIGLGPFVPHHATPFAKEKPGSVETTLRMLAICRIMLPHTLIPSTTALATVGGIDGRLQGILSGANVIMPNLSPQENRSQYQLYDNKSFSHAEAAEGLRLLEQQLQSIGYTISYQRGDYPKTM